MSQTRFFKFASTPYYSSSRDETSCSTSHCKWWEIWKMRLELKIQAFRAQKMTFTKIFKFFTYFDRQRVNFVRIFNLDKVYKLENPPGWDIFQIVLYPKMDSNRNLNGWASVYFQFQILNVINLSQASGIQIFPNTVLLFESGWDILLYESLYPKK